MFKKWNVGKLESTILLGISTILITKLNVIFQYCDCNVFNVIYNLSITQPVEFVEWRASDSEVSDSIWRNDSYLLAQKSSLYHWWSVVVLLPSVEENGREVNALASPLSLSIYFWSPSQCGASAASLW